MALVIGGRLHKHARCRLSPACIISRSCCRCRCHHATMASNKRPKKRSRTAEVPVFAQSLDDALPPLPLPSQSLPILDADVTHIITSFLDGESFITATAVSRAFRNALIPRQRQVSISRFHSYESMKQMNFSGATFFSGRDSLLVTNKVLADLAESFPRLNSVDLSGCPNINVNGIKMLVKGLGPRLRSFTMIRTKVTQRNGDKRMTGAIITTVSAAPNLESLKLVLPTKCGAESLQSLNAKSSLRKLGLMFAGSKPVSLPRNLPQLISLSVWTDFESGFEWSELTKVDYPNVRSLVVTDCQVDGSPCPNDRRLSAEALVSIMSKSRHMEDLTIRLISPWSKLHLERTEQMAHLGAFVETRGIQYTGPSTSNWRYY